jgi:hypothetical protein
VRVVRQRVYYLPPDDLHVRLLLGRVVHAA